MTAPAVATMRALGKERPGRGVELVERPVPAPQIGEVLLRIEAASICGTDYHVYSWDQWAQDNFRPPRVLGHEIAGTVVQLGADVSRVREGDLVGVESHVIDGTCVQCRRGDTHLCRNLKVVGFDLDGGYAQYMVIPEENAIESNGLDPAIVALQEPMGNAVHAAFVEPLEGRTVLVTGCGPIGLCAVGIARAGGAARVFATDTEAYRLELAMRMGADMALNANAPTAVDQLLSETDGDGVEILLEMSGAEAALTEGLRTLTRGGRVSLLGIYPRPVTVDVSDLVIQKGARLYGIFGRKIYETWERTQALLRSGKLDVGPIITHTLSLDEFERGFELIASRHAGKVVFIP
ncbi:MAG: L-threonine 3-dehydrogenase [Candidatus Limnocylindria bacterium]